MYHKNTINNDNHQIKFHKSSLKEEEMMIKFFKKYNVTNYSFTDREGYSKTDGEFIRNEPIIFETKCRNLRHDFYTTTTIEWKKVKAVLNRGLNENKRMFLFFFFEDNYVMMQELFHDVHYSINLKKCPKTTCGDNTLKIKEMVDFKITKDKLRKL